jgi:hypothetical protein
LGNTAQEIASKIKMIILETREMTIRVGNEGTVLVPVVLVVVVVVVVDRVNIIVLRFEFYPSFESPIFPAVAF